jgi:glutamyl-tRNA reductase
MRCDTAKLANLLGVGDDVRTFNTKKHIVPKLVMEITKALNSDEVREILKNIRTLRERLEPEAMEKASSRSRRATVARGVYRARGADASWQMPLQ